MFQKDNFSIVDIGSNSIRLFYVKNGQTTKNLITTKLTEGFDTDQHLKDLQMERTIAGLLSFEKTLDDENIQNRHYFATAGVRHAKNSHVFLEKLLQCGINVKVLSKSDEALAGFLGATLGKCGNFGIIDIGGGSTEIAMGRLISSVSISPNSKTSPANLTEVNHWDSTEIAMGNLTFASEIPTNSLDVSQWDSCSESSSQWDSCSGKTNRGVTLSTPFGNNWNTLPTDFASGFEDFDTKLSYSFGGKSLSMVSNSFEIGALRFSERTKDNEEIMKNEFKKIFNIPLSFGSSFDFYAIGGTATAVGGLIFGISEFDPCLEGKTITLGEIEKCFDSLVGKTFQQIVEMGVSEKRADVIFSGTFLLLNILKSLNLRKIKLTHLGNLEGFAVMNSLI